MAVEPRHISESLDELLAERRRHPAGKGLRPADPRPSAMPAVLAEELGPRRRRAKRVRRAS